MILRELIDTAHVPGGEELRLYSHDKDFMIVLDRNELMSTRQRGSEEALATLSCARIAGRNRPHVLIGGYGVGFTLRAALAVLPADATVTVVELVPKIIEWARGPMAELAAGCLDDPRVSLIIGDVSAHIAALPGSFDAILLDVDNGPDGLVREQNNQLYTGTGLRTAKAALRAEGVLAVWSAAKDGSFVRRLESTGFVVEEVAVHARGTDANGKGKGAKHVIWFAKPTNVPRAERQAPRPLPQSRYKRF